jgi:hypothetical protein
VKLIHVVYYFCYCIYKFSGNLNPYCQVFKLLFFLYLLTEFLKLWIPLKCAKWFLHIFEHTFKVASDNGRLLHSENELIVAQSEMLLQTIYLRKTPFILFFEKVFGVKASLISQKVFVYPYKYDRYLNVYVTLRIRCLSVELSQVLANNIMRHLLIASCCACCFADKIITVHSSIAHLFILIA